MFVKLSFDYNEFKKTFLGKTYRKFKIRQKRKIITPVHCLARQITAAEERYFKKTCMPAPLYPVLTLGNNEKHELLALREFKSEVISARNSYNDKLA